MLYAITATCACLFVFVFSVLVCFQVLLVALRLDSPQRAWIVVCFVFTGVAAGCLFFLFLFVLFLLPLSLSPGLVPLYYMLYFVNKN